MDRFIGESEILKKAITETRLIAKSNAPVIFLGETGVGKELFTDYLHEKSKRSNKPLVKVNCAAIQDTLLESDLFGHEKGAFTRAVNRQIGKLQKADEGTIFLDEIANMSLAIQAKMLRALEYQVFERVGGTEPIQVDIRIVSATNHNINTMIEDGKFRQDLFYRVGVMIIYIPPLRERENDIVHLTHHFIDVFNKKYEKNVTSIPNNTMALLLRHKWPGNIRELRNVIERAILFCDGNELIYDSLHFGATKTDLNALIETTKDTAALLQYAVDNLYTNGYGGRLPDALAHIERAWIVRALEENKYVQKEAATAVGISPRMFSYKIDIYNIPRKKEATA